MLEAFAQVGILFDRFLEAVDLHFHVLLSEGHLLELFRLALEGELERLCVAQVLVGLFFLCVGWCVCVCGGGGGGVSQ